MVNIEAAMVAFVSSFVLSAITTSAICIVMERSLNKRIENLKEDMKELERLNEEIDEARDSCRKINKQIELLSKF
jgi:septal ring factor EnvC (AmiA/AmiB activator)